MYNVPSLLAWALMMQRRFAGKKSLVQAQLKKNEPHAIIIHCHSLHLAIVQAAANSTQGIKHVYTTLTQYR